MDTTTIVGIGIYEGIWNIYSTLVSGKICSQERLSTCYWNIYRIFTIYTTVMDKDIIDLCCGWRMFWHDKNDPLVHFMDIRTLPKGSIKSRPNFSVEPDEIGDYRDVKYPDNTFKIVVLDPPHLRSLWDKSWMAMKYGKLLESRKEDIRKWFYEGIRILQDKWILIFKRSESEIPISEIISLFPVKFSIWNRSGKWNKTIWLIYIKHGNLPPFHTANDIQ